MLSHRFRALARPEDGHIELAAFERDFLVRGIFEELNEKGIGPGVSSRSRGISHQGIRARGRHLTSVCRGGRGRLDRPATALEEEARTSGEADSKYGQGPDRRRLSPGVLHWRPGGHEGQKSGSGRSERTACALRRVPHATPHSPAEFVSTVGDIV